MNEGLKAFGSYLAVVGVLWGLSVVFEHEADKARQAHFEYQADVQKCVLYAVRHYGYSLQYAMEDCFSDVAPPGSQSSEPEPGDW